MRVAAELDACGVTWFEEPVSSQDLDGLAIGTDAAGRRQYRYHDLCREQRDQDKHHRVREFGAVLPRIREVIRRHLDGQDLTRDRVLAATIRLIDLGFFRPGGEEYAGENGTFGLATIRKEHVTLSHGQPVFEYPAKGALVSSSVSPTLPGLTWLAGP